ncbi:nucleotidyl transferase AbiEii/AbiGii toxin family protein [Ruminococcus flavefaciens]|uniref:Nucleotidyltransferase AbiEii toxin of type IV toxin-antitoxin system n=1 Tax=Ruminococcus flavefaciens TaxID=1265 RepID=A0A315Y0V1_RUMFL|nr:nucleotidyl transferase AbiEii/AbiGii toxin family protein [Ruminococcus flavefaciens]PWJ11959.1 nucleotidyltransferase AbiEii toxin of type IV toxin-antitoxin system [Ruminococcus flavefaciens]SSA50269.1 Nucleotidyl transferase AbiEii toxin, Type IV TA system [Ruminococcus flavefaciens]
MLHNKKDTFEQLVLRTSEYLGVKAEIVEKDYFVTLFLKRIAAVMPDIVFKGGTSLSKCYHIIKRFSEDIDLNLQSEIKPPERKRRQLKANIIQIINDLEFELTNPDAVKSRRDYNRYIIDYPSSLSAAYLKEQLIVETAIYQRAYPTKVMSADSLIYQYLHENGYGDFIKQYDLEPFALNVQTAERTMIDKMYALADYYLLNTTTEHSRHIYDIYKLSEIVTVDDTLKELALSVAEERRPHKMCLSVQNGKNVTEILREVIDKKTYKEDYDTITVPLLFEAVSYNTAVSALENILQNGIFDKV